MTTDAALGGLIDQIHLARETYYLRKGQELSRIRHGLTATAQHQLTNAADVAWKEAEAALWRYRATH